MLQPLMLTDAEIAQLTAWSRRPKTARAIAERARIILGSASGAPSVEVADAVGVTRQTVGKWLTRFLAHRLDGLLDAPRPGAPRPITDGDVERVARKTLAAVVWPDFERVSETLAGSHNLAVAVDVPQSHHNSAKSIPRSVRGRRPQNRVRSILSGRQGGMTRTQLQRTLQLCTVLQILSAMLSERTPPLQLHTAFDLSNPDDEISHQSPPFDLSPNTT